MSGLTRERRFGEDEDWATGGREAAAGGLSFGEFLESLGTSRSLLLMVGSVTVDVNCPAVIVCGDILLPRVLTVRR